MSAPTRTSSSLVGAISALILLVTKRRGLDIDATDTACSLRAGDRTMAWRSHCGLLELGAVSDLFPAAHIIQSAIHI